jgi:predicted nucleic acid-binding protein
MPTPLVVDASLAFRLILPGPRQAEVHSRVGQWLADGYVLQAPTLWAYELASALCKTAHFGQISAEEAERALGLAIRLGVQLVAPHEELIRRAFEWTLRLERAAAYDSFYLALAEMLGCELWTADQGLQRAAGVDWVRSVGGMVP